LTFALSDSRLSARVRECQKIKIGGLDVDDAEQFGRLILLQSEAMWDCKG